MIEPRPEPVRASSSRFGNVLRQASFLSSKNVDGNAGVNTSAPKEQGESSGSNTPVQRMSSFSALFGKKPSTNSAATPVDVSATQQVPSLTSQTSAAADNVVISPRKYEVNCS